MLILSSELSNQIKALWQMNEKLAGQVPVNGMQIYRAGMLAGLTALAEAYDLELPELRRAADELCRRQCKPSRHDMRL